MGTVRAEPLVRYPAARRAGVESSPEQEELGREGLWEPLRGAVTHLQLCKSTLRPSRRSQLLEGPQLPPSNMVLGSRVHPCREKLLADARPPTISRTGTRGAGAAKVWAPRTCRATGGGRAGQAGAHLRML